MIATQNAPQRLSPPQGRSLEGLNFCHFTTIHAELKSRSFHRICLPLVHDGAHVTYISPAECIPVPRIDFVRLPRRTSRVGRLLSNWTVLTKLLQTNAHIFHFQDPELLPLALVFKLLFRKRAIYDAYEDFPSMLRESTSIPRPLRRTGGRFVAFAEALAASVLDGIVTADPFTLRRVARKGRSRKFVFSNFPNLDFFPAPSSRPKPFHLVYRGGLSERAGTYDLLEAVQLLNSRSRPLNLLLIGYADNASAESALRDRIHRLGLAANVDMRGRIPHEQMAAALAQARIGICPLRSTAKFQLNVPVKVFEYWACGLPVVASDLPPIRPYFRPTGAGLLFKPGDVSGLARSIEWLLDHTRAADSMGRNGRSAVVSRFNNAAEIRRLKVFLARITAGGRSPNIGGDIANA
jgi:glycosyltransferase involved in cell wall biosynthesis